MNNKTRLFMNAGSQNGKEEEENRIQNEIYFWCDKNGEKWNVIKLNFSPANSLQQSDEIEKRSSNTTRRIVLKVTKVEDKLSSPELFIFRRNYNQTITFSSMATGPVQTQPSAFKSNRNVRVVHTL